MREIDRQYMLTPFYGSRRIVAWLKTQGYQVNRKRVQRLMRTMGLEAIYRRPRTSQPVPGHKVYHYLLRGVEINRVNQAWTADITYIPMAKGFLYVVAIMDWYSRYVLSWRVSNTLEADFCVDALEEALSKGKPEVFNTDQGSQFTSEAFTGLLEQHGVRVSMDGKGRYTDNLFIERLWRSLKYEEVYLKAYTGGSEVGWEKWTPKSDKLERRRCQDEEGPARKVYQGIPAGSSEAGIGRESVIARGRASVVLSAIDVGVLGEAI